MRTSLRRLAACVVGGGFVVAALVAAGSGGDARTHAAPPAAAGPPLLASGVAPVTNGIVVATATPALQRVGASAPVIQVGTAPIDEAGNFALLPDPTSGPIAPLIATALARNNGWVNLDLLETGADGETTIQSIARQYVNAAGQPVSRAAFRAARDAASLGTAGPGSGAVGHWVGEEGDDGSTTVGTEHAVLQQPSPAAAKVAATRIHAAVVPYSCFVISTLHAQKNLDTVVGEFHTANDVVLKDTWFRYGHSADSSVDVGIEISGSGKWNVSGTVHVGNDRGTSVFAKWEEGAQFGYKLKTGFLHKEYYDTWSQSACGSPYFQEKADSWTGTPDGTALGDYNHNLDNNCKNSSWPSNWGPNSSTGRDSYSFTKFGGAFSVWGFSAGAQSGSSVDVQTQYQFGPNANHYLCGNDGSIFTAHRVFAGFG